jgi:hypothetical protein
LNGGFTPFRTKFHQEGVSEISRQNGHPRSGRDKEETEKRDDSPLRRFLRFRDKEKDGRAILNDRFESDQ